MIGDIEDEERRSEEKEERENDWEQDRLKGLARKLIWGMRNTLKELEEKGEVGEEALLRFSKVIPVGSKFIPDYFFRQDEHGHVLKSFAEFGIMWPNKINQGKGRKVVKMTET